MNLQVLGCGEAFGSGGRFNTCFYVESEGYRWLLDCGASALIAMHKFGVEPESLDAVLITHFHADHFGGLPALDRYLYSRGRTRPLLLAGPHGLQRAFEAALDVLFPGAHKRDFGLEFVELQAGSPTAVGPLRVTAFPVVHSPATNPHGLRVEAAGRVLAFSGDTEWTEALLPLAQGAALFLCECTTYDREQKNHLSYAQLMRERPRLQCARVMLTHMGKDVLDRLPLPGVEAAEDGLRLTV